MIKVPYEGPDLQWVHVEAHSLPEPRPQKAIDNIIEEDIGHSNAADVGCVVQFQLPACGRH